MKKVLEALSEMQTKMPIETVFLILVIAFIVAMIIYLTYKNTYTGVMYNPRFNVSLVMITMVTTIVMVVIGSNISVSLGMVGALSIVRFRTAIKEPVDTVYMFWAISVGIMTGAGIYLVAVLSSVGIGLFYFISYMMGFKLSTQYLLIVKYNIKDDNEVTEKVKNLGKTKLKSKNITKDVVEISYEVEVKDNIEEILKDFENNEKIINVSIISYQNDFGM